MHAAIYLIALLPAFAFAELLIDTLFRNNPSRIDAGMQSLFTYFDTNRDNGISQADIDALFNNNNPRQTFDHKQFVKDRLSELDADRDGIISAAEFAPG